MRRSLEKLHMRRGASAVVALVIFAVAAIIGAAVVSAATAGLGSAAYQKTEQKSYLAVTSAAALLRETIENDVVRISETEEGGVTAREYAYLPEEEGDTALSGLLVTLVREAWENSGTEPPYGRLALTVSGHEDMDVDIWLTLYPEQQKLEAVLCPAGDAVTSSAAAAQQEHAVVLVFTNLAPRLTGEPTEEEDESGVKRVVTRYETVFSAENCYARGGAD